MPSPFSPLNWVEISQLAQALSSELEGLFVDRIIVPERARFPTGFLKGEWALRFTGRRREATLVFSVRPRKPYFYLVDGKGPRAAPGGTHSAFDLSMTKNLKGRKLEKIEAVARERYVVLWFAPLTVDQSRLGLVLSQIPALPEALLVNEGSPAQVVARTRLNQAGAFEWPRGDKSPEGLAVRGGLEPQSWCRTVERAVEAEAFEVRVRVLEKELRELVKHAADRARQNETAVVEAERENDWQRFGDLLKGAIGVVRAPERVAGPKGEALVWRVTDYESGSEIAIPADPKLDMHGQVERFYSLARRKRRRIDEARMRLENFAGARDRSSAMLARVPSGPAAEGWGDWRALEALENEARRLTGRSAPAAGASAAEIARDKKRGGWLGKSFVSKDGMTILAGRSKDENLELTFKHARGNDLWMHVRGKPGSHVVIPIPSGKSAPLETLLDAAALCIHYSGGSNWGTTEVDYTFKKYVKRIRDSTEASYTNNKTLLVQPDQERLKRLLGQ